MEPSKGYFDEEKERILRAYRERSSMRAIERIFGVSRRRQSQHALEVAQKKGRQQAELSATLLPAEEGDVLELDEAWSFAGRKKNKRWLYAEISATSMCRRTRQIVAFVIGDRSARTCATQKFLLFWAKIPDGYKACQSFSDFWKAYAQAFSTETHEQVEKGSGETAHVERFFGTLRQHLARYVRKTLSFSKSERMHHLVTKWFIAEYNTEQSLSF